MNTASSLIGEIRAAWQVDGRPRSAMAAVLKVATGRGMSLDRWGASVLCLRWIGDPPEPEIAQSVYDVMLDRGPTPGRFEAAIESMASSADAPSYRPVRHAAAR